MLLSFIGRYRPTQEQAILTQNTYSILISSDLLHLLKLKAIKNCEGFNEMLYSLRAVEQVSKQGETSEPITFRSTRKR